jgi:hypothetical protein
MVGKVRFKQNIYCTSTLYFIAILWDVVRCSWIWLVGNVKIRLSCFYKVKCDSSLSLKNYWPASLGSETTPLVLINDGIDGQVKLIKRERPACTFYLRHSLPGWS